MYNVFHKSNHKYIIMPKDTKEAKSLVLEPEVLIPGGMPMSMAAERAMPSPSMLEPTMPEQTISAPTMKHHFIAGSIAAGIVLSILSIIWISFKIIPAVFSGGASFVATTLNSTFIPNGGETKTTEPAKKNNPTKSTSTSKPANTAPAAVQNYYGSPDLAVTLIATGIIDPVSKQFVQTNFASANDEIAVRFQVRNIGTNISGSWTLRLNMPSRTTPVYDSNQPSIRPGDRIEYTASFNSPMNQGLNTGNIIIDPFNTLSESSYNNNNLPVQFNVNGAINNYNNYYYNNGGYNTGYPYYGQPYNGSSINVNCYANPQSATRGSVVTWYATATGGNGYFTYYWTGDDSLYSTNNAVNHVYYIQGNKYATVSVTSGGQTVTRQCSTYIY
jgi:hypothetical protein